jgi:hypothetical protein
MKLTLFQRRFLIIWVTVNSFALLSNLAMIRGIIETQDSTIFLFTNYNLGTDSDFWPFTSYYQESIGTPPETTSIPGDVIPGTPPHYFYGGLFNSYGIPEYICYMVLGLAIIFIPKFWK